MNNAGTEENGAVLIRTAAVVDARGVTMPGALLIENSERGSAVIAAGSPDQVASHPRANLAEPLDLSDSIVLPALVNAHTHLDLTHIGPRPYDPADGFTSWAGVVIKNRRTDDAGIARSVEDGIARSLAGGVAAVGDISGGTSEAGLDALRRSPLMGVSFREFFGRGRSEADAIDGVRSLAQHKPVRADGVALGISPHAPYSAGLKLQHAAAEAQRDAGLLVCTHLAETPEEREFVASGTGPFQELLEMLGVWDDTAGADVGKGETPIGCLAPVLGLAPVLVAHVNDCSDEDLQILARTNTRVAYCPRASTYFGQHRAFGPHRYREMLDAGVIVALGTDSIINLPEAQADRLSVWDEVRFLHQRDAVDIQTLVRMATVNGAQALGLQPDLFDFSVGPVAGVISVACDGEGADPIASALSGSSVPQFRTGMHA